MIKKKFYNFKYKKRKKNKVLLVLKKITLTIRCNSNNTIFHVKFKNNKNIIVSTGMLGFKGSKCATVYAAQQTTAFVCKKLKKRRVDGVFVFFKNFSKVRKSIIKTLKKNKIKLLKIIDRTSLAHNGCRKVKKRRL
jgi:small subunit ribosomal protein S11